MKFKNFSIMVAKLRLLLRLHSTGVSQRQISKQIGLSRTCIRTYLDRLLASGNNTDELLKIGDGELLNLAQGEIHRQQPDKRLEILNPLLESYAKESRRRNVTLQLLWEEYYAKYKDELISNPVSKEVMTARHEWYIKTILEYVNKWEAKNGYGTGNHIIWTWDVVNEAIADDATKTDYLRGYTTSRKQSSSRFKMVSNL